LNINVNIFYSAYLRKGRCRIKASHSKIHSWVLDWSMCSYSWYCDMVSELQLWTVGHSCSPSNFFFDLLPSSAAILIFFFDTLLSNFAASIFVTLFGIHLRHAVRNRWFRTCDWRSQLVEVLQPVRFLVVSVRERWWFVNRFLFASWSFRFASGGGSWICSCSRLWLSYHCDCLVCFDSWFVLAIASSRCSICSGCSLTLFDLFWLLAHIVRFALVWVRHALVFSCFVFVNPFSVSLFIMASDKVDTFLVRFNGKNYAAWEFQFKLFVKGK